MNTRMSGQATVALKNSDRVTAQARSEKKIFSIGLTAILVGISFFVLAFGWYSYWFWDMPISTDPANWGVFGDYLGGMVNPLLGLVTICLLTASLHQNNKMLQKAEEELELALIEISRGIEIQEMTKLALDEQINLTRQQNLFNSAQQMYERFNNFYEQNKGSQAKRIEAGEASKKATFLNNYMDHEFSLFFNFAYSKGLDISSFLLHEERHTPYKIRLIADIDNNCVGIRIMRERSNSGVPGDRYLKFLKLTYSPTIEDARSKDCYSYIKEMHESALSVTYELIKIIEDNAGQSNPELYVPQVSGLSLIDS